MKFEELEVIKSQIVGEFNRVADEMKALVKEQSREMVEVKTTSEGTASSITEHNDKMESLLREHEEVKSQINEMIAEGSRLGGGGREAQKSIGAQFTESDQFKDYRSGGMTGKSQTVPFERLDTKGLTSEDGSLYGQMGHLIEPQSLGVINKPEAPQDLRQLIPTIQTSSDTVSYVEELGYANIYTELDAPVTPTATSIVVKATAGFFEGQAIYLAAKGTPNNRTTHTVVAIDQLTRTVTLSAAVGIAYAANDAVTSDAIGMTPHGAQKPEASLLGFIEQSYPVGTMAHYMVVHRQTLADIPQLKGLIDNRLLTGLASAVELQLLYGNGNSPNLRGIMNNANIQVHPNFTGTKDTNGVWRLDHVRRAITRAQIAQMPPSAGLMHPNDWQEIELAKGSDNHYVWVTVQDGGTERLWRLNIRVTPSVRQGSFLLGAFNQGAYILDREQANVRVSDQHKDFFTSNMLAVLAEQRLGFAVIRPQAFVKGSWA